MNTLKFNRKKLRYILFCGLATASAVPPAAAATLWSVPEYLGTGYFWPWRLYDPHAAVPGNDPQHGVHHHLIF